MSEAEYQLELSVINTFNKNGISTDLECQPNRVEEILKDPETTDCEAIKPTKSSDCLLSEEDKKYFKYCCYERIEGIIAGCSAFTQQTYEDELSYIKFLDLDPVSGIAFECNTGTVTSSKGSYLSFENLIIYLTLILL